MQPPAQTSEPTPTPAAPKARATPPCIAFLLNVVQSLLRYGRKLDEIIPTKADHPRFPTLAAGFGTHDVRRILAHVNRGILRAMMLRKYLLARAGNGRDIAPTPPPEPAQPGEIEALDFKLRAPVQPAPRTPRRPAEDPDDPLSFSIPTLKELEFQVRRRSVGRTIADICLDLGLTPSHCAGETWNDILQALTHFGASFEKFFGTQQRRKETFQKERDRRPETWTYDWRDRPREAMRELLGALA